MVNFKKKYNTEGLREANDHFLIAKHDGGMSELTDMVPIGTELYSGKENSSIPNTTKKVAVLQFVSENRPPMVKSSVLYMDHDGTDPYEDAVFAFRHLKAVTSRASRQATPDMKKQQQQKMIIDIACMVVGVLLICGSIFGSINGLTIGATQDSEGSKSEQTANTEIEAPQ